MGLRRCNQHAGEGLAPAGGSGQGTGGAELKQGRAGLEVGARARTLNMSFMLSMLERSKSSGWLNFFAFCRVAREVIQGGVRCGLGGERAVGAVVAQAARREAARREAARLEVGLGAHAPKTCPACL